MTNQSEVRVHDNRVFYLGEDSTLAMGLAAIIQPRGLTLDAFEELAELEPALVRVLPAVLVLDLRAIPDDLDMQQLIGHLATGEGRRPEVLCIADDSAMETRLAAMRAGARSVVPPPIVVEDLARRIIKLSRSAVVKPPRILVVEDDPVQAQYIAVLLQEAGMDVHVVGEPLEILDRMQEVRPDLVLMDLYMPGANGAELTAIIRDQDAYLDTPILFLSAETDPDKQLDALRVGGDGFIAKPVQRDRLIGAIEHRIQLYRWLRGRRVGVERSDNSRGTLAKDAFLRAVDRVVHAGPPAAEGQGVLLVEVDRPEDLLEGLGLKGIERLLRRLELTLSRQLAAHESLARLDDFTFAILAHRETPEALDRLGQQILFLFASSNPAADAGHPTLGVSVGIGLFTPAADDAITMVSRGRTALARARQDGGNQVRLWTPAVAPDLGSESERLIRQLIRTALDHDGLQLLFQPIVSLGANAGELYEAQLRLRTTDGEQIPAAAFLPVAERAGLMPRIDRWVLNRALDVMDSQRVTHPRLRLLIHQRLESVQGARWLVWFRDQMVQRNLIRRRPMLQFQMRDVRENLASARTMVTMLGKYGIQVGVANVTGEASDLALLSDLPIKLAKLSFDVLSSTEPDDLARIVGELRARGILVIAAGIEDAATIARVWGCRPDYIQGNSLQMPSSELVFDFHHSVDAP